MSGETAEGTLAVVFFRGQIRTGKDQRGGMGPRFKAVCPENTGVLGTSTVWGAIYIVCDRLGQAR
jgi:hypothetical protein